MTARTRLSEMRAVERLVARDATLFVDADVAAQRIGWTGSPALAADEADGLSAFAEEVKGEDITDVILLGMGGSSLAPLVLSRSIATDGDAPSLHVLDTTSPLAVGRLLTSLDPAATLVVVSSKSGTTVEPRALCSIFLDWARRGLGDEAGSHFVAVTDPGSDLEDFATGHGFRRVFLAPPDVGGRYAALTPFGTVPSSLAGVDIARLAASALFMEDRCEIDDDRNPGAELAAWLIEAAEAGRDKVTILCSPGLEAFGLWVEQLVAESTGKGGRGLLPVLETATDDHSAHGPDRMTFLLRLQQDHLTSHALLELPDDEPRYEAVIEEPYDLGGEFVRWEWAVALFSAVSGIEPFDQPNVAEAKTMTTAILAGGAGSPDTASRVSLNAAPEASGGVDPATALDDLFARLKPPAYLAVLAYLPEVEALLAPLREACARVSTIMEVAVTFELGPRYLHSTGQYHKGGPENGSFIVVTAAQDPDIVVPGEEFTLGRLHRAQAEGDVAALVSHGRPVVHVDMPRADVAHIGRLAAIIMETVERRR